MASVTTDAATAPHTQRPAPEWARRYPPLVAMAVALLIALAILPSALNLPQSNPSQTLEYAPVPPDDETPPETPPGNVNQFGLGGSSSLQNDMEELEETLDEEVIPPELPEDDGIGTLGKNPSTKRCVGSPPRQTEDPNSPPCVANFEGDNFGSTYLGVTRDEVRVLLYLQGFINYVQSCREPNQVTPDGQYFDLVRDPIQPDEHCMVRVARVWQQYFNDRYQTYGRFVHFFVYFSSRGESNEARQADAADNYSQVKPFAVVSTAMSHADAYLEAMAKKNVLVFGSQLGRSHELFRRHPKKAWGYPPALEVQADMFISYICTKLAPYPVSFTGPSVPTLPHGSKRVYGMWRTRDKGHPELQHMARVVKEGIKKECGIEIEAEQTFPSAGFLHDNGYSTKYAQDGVAEFKNKKVTTVIWPAGLETHFSKYAAANNYRPEIVALGDRTFETDEAGGYQEQSVWGNARMITYITQAARLEDEPCWDAYKSTDPAGDRTEIDLDACPLYDDIRQLFIGIQVAGPRLGPTNVDKGFHAIPKKPSADPQVPACYYERDDYTCVKDSMVERWDPLAEEGTGCYRATEAGKRYERFKWPTGDALAQDKPNDPCNSYTHHNLTDPNGLGTEE